MKKIKYILKRLESFDYHNLNKIINKIHEKTNRSRIIILFSIIYCSIRFGSGYMDYYEFEFYLLSHRERKSYLTSILNNQIIQKYNNKDKRDIFHNKITFLKTFKKYIYRDYIDLRESDFNEFKMFIEKHSKFIGKVIDDCGGKGITIYNSKEYELKELYELLKTRKQVLLEELIQQDKEMNQLYAKSINSLRIISFVKDNGEVVILNRVLRIGNGGSVDNFSSGGMYTFLSETGKIMIPAIDEQGNVYKDHPLSKVSLVGYQVPHFEEAIKYVKELALVVPEVRYVGWDIAITDKGVDVIEGNEYSGIFQMKPSLTKEHIGLLDEYRKYMDL